jgi:hypothetical protein
MRVRLSTIMSTPCDDLEATLEFGESSMADEDTNLSPDLKKALELAKNICAKK